jgi:predicted ester cyclase
MTDSERQLGWRWFEEVWNQGRRQTIGEMIAPGAVLHECGADIVGADGFYPFYDRMIAAFSEIHVTVDDTIVDNDKLCVRWTFTARHTGQGMCIAPTGVRVNATGISILRIADMKFAEGWQNWDMLGLLEQMKGVAQSPTYAAAS